MAIISLTLASIGMLWAYTAQQCFTTNFESRAVYSQDFLSFDLSNMAKGDLLSFELSTTTPGAQIQNTFSKSQEQVDLDGGPLNCVASANFNNTDFVYLCDGNKAVFVGYSELDGTVLRNKALSLDPDLNCMAATSSPSIMEAYLLCLGPKKSEQAIPDLVIVAVEPLIPSQKAVLNVQQYPTTALLSTLSLVAFNKMIEGSEVTLLYAFENKENVGVKFHLFKKNQDGILINGGFYSADANITGVGKDDKFLSVLKAGSEVFFIQRKKSSGSVYAQRCYPSPVEGKFNCQSDATFDFEVTEANVAVAEKKSEVPQLNLKHRLVIASNKQIKAYYFDPESSPLNFDRYGAYDISSASISTISRVFFWSDRIYLTGFNTGMKNVIVLYRTNAQNYEERVSDVSEPNFSIANIRQGTYDTDVDETIAVSQGKSYFSSIYKPLLLVTPNTGAKKMAIAVDCLQAGKSINQKTLNLDVLVNINDNGTIRLSDSVKAYTTSAVIAVPACSDDIDGNAPNIVVESLKEGVPFKFKIDYARQLSDVSFQGDAIKGILDFRYVGQGLFIIINDQKITLVFCVAVGNDKGQCVQQLAVPFQNKRFLDAEVTDEQILFMYADQQAPVRSSLKRLTQQPSDKLYLDSYSLKDFKKLTSKVYDGYKVRVGILKTEGNRVFSILVGYMPGEVLTQRLMSAIIDVTKDYPAGFTPFLVVPDHMCINDMEFAPRGQNVLYMASSCGTALSSRIYEVWINFLDLKSSAIVKIYGNYQTTRFAMCPTGIGLNVVDFDNGIVFSHDTTGDEDYRASFPTSEYGVKLIKDYHCDQENKIVQILGTDKEGEVYRIVTFRGETLTNPSERVHSVYVFSDSTPAFITSTYNDIGDEMNTILFESDSSSISFFKMYIGAPYITINASEVLAPGDYPLSYVISFPGKDNNISVIRKNQTLTLVNQTTDISIKPKEGKKPLVSNSLVNLDDNWDVTGPVYKFEMPQADGPLTLRDRFNRSDQFKNITVVFERSIFDGDLIFGYNDERIMLVKDNNILLSIYEKQTISLDSMEDGSGFFALTLPSEGKGINNEIIAMLNITGEFATYRMVLTSGTFNDMVFLKIAQNLFVYAGFDNSGYNIEIGLLKVDKDQLVLLSHQNILNDDNIIDFEAQRIGSTDYFVVISCEQQSRYAKFNLFKVANGQTLEFNGEQKDYLVPQVSTIHDEIDFACIPSALEQNSIDCIHVEENMHSYFVRYSFNLQSAEANLDSLNANATFMKGTILRTLNNMVNLKPIRAAISTNYSAVIVKNQAPNLSKLSGVFAEEFLLLIYAFNYQDDPFKIITSSDLELPKGTFLEDLWPFFFKQSQSATTKLGVNVGQKETSIRVFNIEPLYLVVGSTNDIQNQASFKAVKADGAAQSYLFKDFYAFGNGRDDTPSSGGWLWAILVIIVVGAVTAVLIYLCLKKPGEEEYQQANEVEKWQASKFDSENTIKADETKGVAS